MQITALLMKNRCIPHYLMSYKLRDQMSEALATSHSESLLQLNIICQHKIPKLFQTIWCSACSMMHTGQVGVFITKSPAVPRVQNGWTYYLTASGLNEVEEVRTFAKGRTSSLNYNLSHADPCQLLASNYYISEEIIILCSISVTPEQNVFS